MTESDVTPRMRRVSRNEIVNVVAYPIDVTPRMRRVSRNGRGVVSGVVEGRHASYEACE